jgi:hypothetical protein
MKGNVQFILAGLLFAVLGINAQNLNIGNLTAIKVVDNTIYVAGQKGIAALNIDKTIQWQCSLPETTIRLIEANESGVIYSSYVFEGKKGQLLSAFSSLWDKVSFAELTVAMIDKSGNPLWTTQLGGKSKLSAPAVSRSIVAVSSNDSLYTFDLATGRLKSQVYCNEKFILGKSIKDHAIPNKPLITEDAVFNAAPFKLTKSDFSGKILESKEQYGALQALPVMTVSPLLFEGQIFIANSPVGKQNTKEGTARLYCVDGKLDKNWDSFVDVNGQTGISSLTNNKTQIFVATNGAVLAFNVKGKKLWECNKNVGVPDLRGVKYPGMGSTLASKISAGDFLLATEQQVYLASGVRVKKNWTNQILILDAGNGKPVKTVDLNATVVDMDLIGEKLVFINEANEVIIL